METQVIEGSEDDFSLVTFADAEEQDDAVDRQILTGNPILGEKGVQPPDRPHEK